jgi:hypothetical protein
MERGDERHFLPSQTTREAVAAVAYACLWTTGRTNRVDAATILDAGRGW